MVEAVIKERAAVQTSTKRAQEGRHETYLAFVSFLLRGYATDDKTAIVDDDIQNFW